MRPDVQLPNETTAGFHRRVQRFWLGAVFGLFAAARILTALGSLAVGPYYVSPSGNDGNNCTSMVTACLTIGSAISKATSGDTIVVAAGVYTENLTIDDSLTLIGFGADATVIDGGNQPAWAVAILTDAVVSLAGVRVVHGSGGIWNRGVLRLTRSTVINNWGPGGYPWWEEQGAGIRNSGQLQALESVIADNYSYFWGGGIYNRGIASFVDSTIGGNEASDTGGGIFNWAGSLTLKHTTVISNKACGSDPFPNPLCTLSFSDSSASKPTASFAGLAGGIANYAVLTATDTLFAANRAFNRAGGIYNRGMVMLLNATLSQNSTVEFEGGALLNHSGTIQATNVTISGNNASPDDGIYMTDGTITLTNVTMSGDISGTNIYHAANPTTDTYLGTITLHNTMVANDLGGANCFGPILSLGHNLESGNTCGFTATGDLTNTNPLLGPLQDNGGPTPTRALLPGSPAINAGDNVACPATDQRGVPRPQAGRCDIGAYEYVFPVETYLPFLAR